MGGCIISEVRTGLIYTNLLGKVSSLTVLFVGLIEFIVNYVVSVFFLLLFRLYFAIISIFVQFRSIFTILMRL